MGLHLHQQVLIFIILLISQVHLSTCRSIREAEDMKTGSKQKVLITAKFSALFSESFSALKAASSMEIREDGQVENQLHVVSRRRTPGGPNALHN